MGLVKFNKTATEYEALHNYERDVIYFPTDRPSIYLNGSFKGGRQVPIANGSYFGINYEDYPTSANYSVLNAPFRYVFHDTNIKNLPPSRLIESAAEYQDIDIVLQSFGNSEPVKSEKQVCELTWPNGTSSSNADITPVYEKWQRIIVGSTFYEWQKVYSSDVSERPLELYFDCDVNNAGSGNMSEYLSDGDWTHANNMPSIISSKIYDYVKNGGHDITIHLQHTIEFSGSAVVKSTSVSYDYYDGTHTVSVVWGNGTNSVTTIEQYEG